MYPALRLCPAAGAIIAVNNRTAKKYLFIVLSFSPS
jgi:hypothetical protein